MVDLAKFYTTHRDQLRKWLPCEFDFNIEGTETFSLLLGFPGKEWELSDEIASIFLEHAARSAVEEEGVYLHRGWFDSQSWSDDYQVRYRNCFKPTITTGPHVTALEALSAALDTMFPPPQEPG